MKSILQDIPFPQNGLAVNVGFDTQPQGTTRSATNVRAYEPRGGTWRGGQRSGLTKFCPTAMPAPIQDITVISTTTSTPQPGVIHGSFLHPASTDGRAGMYGITGQAVATPGFAGYYLARCVWLNGQCYYADQGIVPGSPNSINVYKIDDLGNNLWGTVPHQTNAGGVLLTFADLPHPVDAQGRTQCFGIETDGSYVYIGTRYITAGMGQGGSSPKLAIYKVACSDGSVVGGYTGSFWAVPWFQSASSSTAPTLGAMVLIGNLLAVSQDGVTVSFIDTAAATVSATYTSSGTLDFGLYDLCTDGTSLYAVHSILSGVNTFSIVKISTAGALIWETAVLLTGDTNILNLCYDSVSNKLLATATGGSPNLLVLNPATGATIASIASPGGVSTWSQIQPIGGGGFNLFLGATTNNYMQLSENLTVNVGKTTINGFNVPNPGYYNGSRARQDIFTNTQPTAQLSPVQTRAIVTAGGEARRFSSAGLFALTGGQSMNPNASVIFTAVLNQNVYYVDGIGFHYYDAATDTVVPLVASAGALPVDSNGGAPRLIANYRNRLVFSGLIGDPSNIFMSALNAPTDWDYSPVSQSATQAWAGNANGIISAVGVVSDIVNCLATYSQDILIVGGDHTIVQITGDPMGGGRIDLISDGIGMAFGKPFCRDGSGTLYFVSSRGSIYRWTPGVMPVPERISDSISELVLRTNWSQNICRMAWDERQGGFHVFITPLTVAATKHYFYDVRNNSWWQDVFADTKFDPIAIEVYDAQDGSDRAILLGGRDGFIRKLDVNALDDDGIAISSTVMLGPIRDKNNWGTILKDIQTTLDSASNKVNYSVYVGESAQSAFNSTAKQTGVWTAGRNHSIGIRRFGHCVFVRISSENTLNSSWVLEKITANLGRPEGKIRERQF